MPPIVAVIAPGMMGTAVGRCLSTAGLDVRTLLAGRSADSRERAAAAGMRDVPVEQIVEADFILSIMCPPVVGHIIIPSVA